MGAAHSPNPVETVTRAGTTSHTFDVRTTASLILEAPRRRERGASISLIPLKVPVDSFGWSRVGDKGHQIRSLSGP